MPLYDVSHNPLTPNVAVGTLVDGGSDPQALYNEAVARLMANVTTAITAASPAIPVDGSGNLAFTLATWQTLCRWAARPLDSFDTLRTEQLAKLAMDAVATTGYTGALSQATILLDLIWNWRTLMRAGGDFVPNPVRSPNDWGISPWVLTTPTVLYGLGPDGGASTATRLLFGATDFIRQPVWAGTAIAGRSYTFRCWLKNSLFGKGFIGLTLGATSGSGDDVATQITLTANWTLVSISKLFTLSGTQISIGLDNRTGATQGGDGVGGTVWCWGASLTCES